MIKYLFYIYNTNILRHYVLLLAGYLVEGGLNRLSYGGGRVTDNLNSCLIEYRLFTPVEHLITRLVKEKVSIDYIDKLLTV